jgi:predicted RNase H-like HicB family nuclease
MTMTYTVIIERTATGYGAHVPDLPGCIATGKSRAEVISNIKEAMPFHLYGLRRDGLPFPTPSKGPFRKPSADAEQVPLKISV